ncbi:dihydrofolate reductase family protein [Amycolatopsis sp. NPDC051372]|uniref:dihydrofolate reductase family protein n=1 Tax=Amycolatopsis sp. NPDC051372 TaxID=3155669 RepID=UPI00343CC224
MRPLRYTINVTLDGCVDHRAIEPDTDTHQHATAALRRADALLFGRVTYEMMEAAWGPHADMAAMPTWTRPFHEVIDPAKKYVVSSTLAAVDWNAELITGDLADSVRRLKAEPGEGLYVGGVRLPLALAELGLIDEYEFLVHPRIAGYGPKLFEGLPTPLDLRLVNRHEFGSGAVALTYEPKTT